MKRIICAALLLLYLCSAAGCGTEPAAPEQQVEVPISEPTPAPTVVTQSVSVEVAFTPAPSAVPTPEPTSTPAPLPLEGIVIGIDPGHQLHADSKKEPVAPGSSETKARVSGGAHGIKSGATEQKINLEVGLRLQTLLVENGATVVMTRIGEDVSISNSERATLMNDANVDLAIRLHCNGNDKTEIHGAYMLIPSEKRTDTFDLNKRAAQAVIDAYCATTGIEQAKNDVIERSDQTGFNWSTRPVICIEMGFLTNPSDDAFLSDEASWDVMAQGLYSGLYAFFFAEGRANPTVTPEATLETTPEATPQTTPEA